MTNKKLLETLKTRYKGIEHKELNFANYFLGNMAASCLLSPPLEIPMQLAS